MEALKQSQRAREREREREKQRQQAVWSMRGCWLPLVARLPPTHRQTFRRHMRESERIYTYTYAQTYARRINLQAVCQNKRRVKLKLARALKENISATSLLIIYHPWKENFTSFHIVNFPSLRWKFSFSVLRILQRLLASQQLFG
jgi:hypothetical protein